MLRVCPKCHSNLGLHDYYFCTTCGEQLPKELVRVDDSFRIITEVHDDKDEQPFWVPVLAFMKKQISVVPASVLVLGIVSVMIFLTGLYMTIRKNMIINKPVIVEPVTETVVEINNVVDSPEEIPLIVKDYAEYVPYESDAFIETNDMGFVSDIFTQIDPYYSDFISGLMPLVEPHAGLYLSYSSTFPSLTLILTPLEETDKNEFYDIDKYPWMSYGKFDDKLIISSDQGLVERSNRAGDGLVKNLTHHPKYIILSNQEIDKGDTVILFLNIDGENLLKNIVQNLDTVKYADLKQSFSDVEKNYVIM